MRTHRPSLAPPDGYDGPRRALLLAGGGMRVSWQAGVLRALAEQGLVFTHGDGTSGGIMNLAALLSGVTPEELCERWRCLEPRQFSSLMPLPEYFRLDGPMALGNADGVVTEVFPRLGIDVERVRSARGIAACFNVCNFDRKTVEAVPHERVRLEHLVAGMSLPIFMPPVDVDGMTYTDAVWIKDANLIDAVRRGANELWLVWCIGNTPDYRAGAFDQYVHMIEMSANGALTEEFDRIREINERIRSGEPAYGHTRPITLHVIRPEYPLPLDPEYFFGKITAAELIDRGYVAARQYLDRMHEDGVPFQPETMIMRTAESPGISFSEVMKGGVALGETDPAAGARRAGEQGWELAMHATVTVRDLDRFVADPEHKGSLRATVDYGPWGSGIPSGEGLFQLFAAGDDGRTKLMVYEFPLEHGGERYYFAGRKEVRDDPGFDLWKDTTTLFVRLHRGADRDGPVVGAGVLSLGAADFAKVLANVQVIDGSDPATKVKTLAKFGRFFAGELWDSYQSRAE
jgi:predicted acylesterase/phospholipase RssA